VRGRKGRDEGSREGRGTAACIYAFGGRRVGSGGIGHALCVYKRGKIAQKGELPMFVVCVHVDRSTMDMCDWDRTRI